MANHPGTQRLIERTGMLLHTFNSIELSNTINGLSKLGRHPGRVFMQAFTEAVSAALWTFNAQVRGDEHERLSCLCMSCSAPIPRVP